MEDKTIPPMYGFDETVSKKIKKTPAIKGRLQTFNNKVQKVELNEEEIEIVNPAYVEKLEDEIRNLKRDLKSSSAKINQLVRAINVLTSDVAEAKREIRRKQDLY